MTAAAARVSALLASLHCARPCGGTADAADLKSAAWQRACGFDSHRGHCHSGWVRPIPLPHRHPHASTHTLRFYAVNLRQFAKSALRAAAYGLAGCLTSVSLAVCLAVWSPLGDEVRSRGASDWTLVRPRPCPPTSSERLVSVGLGVTSVVEWAESDGVEEYVGTISLLGGWPWPAMTSCAIWGSETPPRSVGAASDYFGTVLWGIKYKGRQLWTDRIRAIPTRPTMPGLLYDSAFMALLIWTAGWTFRSWRKIKRFLQNKCTHCGHSLTDAQLKCPECGRNREHSALRSLRQDARI